MKKILACILGMMLSTSAIADDHAVEPSTEMEWTLRKGLRFGYNYMNNATDSEKLKSPHMFAIGFEAQQTLAGGSWLDLLFIQNVIISGLEQSVLAPSANVLVGFEIIDALQIGVGANLSPGDPSGENNFVHLVTGIGWTQGAGTFSVPVHLVYVPDINGYWRLAATTGVNW